MKTFTFKFEIITASKKIELLESILGNPKCVYGGICGIIRSLLYVIDSTAHNTPIKYYFPMFTRKNAINYANANINNSPHW